MSQVLNRVLDVDPNNSDAVKDALTTFFQNLPKHTEVDPYKWLRSLETAITRFPKYCMSHRSTIETFLTHFLDSTNYYYVIEAAKCAHAVQQVRPTQEKTATAKSCWRAQMMELCHAAHSLISAMFPQAHSLDIFKYSTEEKNQQTATSLSPLSSALSQIATIKAKTRDSTLNKQPLLCIRLKNIFIFLQAMLVEVYPVAKPIRPEMILDVIVRALSVSSGTNLTGSQQISDIVVVKTQALRNLDALVACLGSNLIPFSPLVFRFVMQTLKWSSDHPSEESRKVRVAAYNSLTQWLSVLHTHRATPGRGRCWEDELTAHVIGDVTPPRHIVQLTVSNQSTKHLSKKAKRKLANSMLQKSSIASHMPGEKNKVPTSQETNDDVAIAALECAETFLAVCGIFLKPTTHKLFQERLVRECYSLHSYAHDRAAVLLRALDACRKTTPPGVPPPTQYCLHLYSTLLNHEHREISKFCSQALLDIRLHLHCSPPSLNFAIEIQSEKQNRTEDRKKKVSERNRAALEALLGAENMPTQDNEEIITIADEPASKRSRLDEDITDKISVSSESISSIEISDDSEEEDSIVQEVEVVIEKVRENEDLSEENVDTVEENTGTKEVELDDVDGKEIEQLNENFNNKKDYKKTIGSAIKENPQKNDNVKYVQENMEADSTEPERIISIYEARTQMPVNTSNIDTDEEERPLSMEVAYDYPCTSKKNVTVLETMEDENLPSTNDTDDVQITCAQVGKYSQDIGSEKKYEEPEVKVNEDTPKVNGVDKYPQKVIGNGTPEDLNDKVSNITIKAVTNDGVTVEDMLADFVDEVNDDNTQINSQS